ncbi:MAG: amino acid permease [Desulfurococcales archaeon]|nr:amino acid permease [Desulfurococcales archaeon]
MSGRLGFWEIYSIGVGGMIGGGIFATLGLSLELARGAAPLAFLLAGLVALVTSYSYAKLSARYPSSGGTIEFLVKAYGDNVFTGGLNIMLLSSYIVMIALYAHAFGAYGASLAPGHYHTLYITLVVLVIGFFTLVNALGAVVSGRVEMALVGFKLAVLLLVAAVGLGLVDWSRLDPRGWPPPIDIVAGGMVIFLAYEGFELVANASGDARDTTVVRRALYSSVATVIGVYTLIALVSAGALTPETVERARDYALAALVEPVLGGAGSLLVAAAAMASTGSAINATLYGTARMSYVIAKYGEAPQLLARRVWRGAYEGLLVISGLSLALALGASLEAISVAGSGGFLIVFAAVNLAAYKLRKKVGANPIITLAGASLSLLALATLAWRMYTINPRQLALLAAMLAGSLLSEYTYRTLTGRSLPKTVDPRLPEREAMLREWESLAKRAAETIKKVVEEAEVYVIGSHARGEPEKAGDIDLLIAAPRKLLKDELDKVKKVLEEELNLPQHHPLHLHTASKHEMEKYSERKRIG